MNASWSVTISRWLRRGPPRHYRGPEVPSILRRLDSLVQGGGHALDGMREGPRLAETYWHPLNPLPSERLTRQADDLLAGRFRPAHRFPEEVLGFPPPWHQRFRTDDNWLSSLHGLEWLIPLVHAHVGAPDQAYLRACVRAIEDWIRGNPFRGAPSRFSWHDHAAAKRLRLFAWFWQQYCRNDDYDLDFAQLLVASVYQHCLYHMDDRNYRRDSNHGLEAIGALWAAAITFPIFRDAPAWEEKARGRLGQWIADNLSPEGFHMEQSPAYHWFVLLRLAAIDRFLRANDRALDELSDATERAARVWPYLLKPNGVIPTVGDSSPTAPANWPAVLERRWGRTPPSPIAPSAPSDEPGAPALLVSPRAGYAILASEPPPYGNPDATYLLFRCRAFESPHCHCDALSFILYGFSRDWLVDPGYLSYQEWDPRRQYLRSPGAHSLVLVDAQDFRTRQNDVADWGRTKEGDFAVAYHDLPRGRHTRRVLLTRGGEILVHDEVTPVRRRWLPWAQLFQIAPDLEVVPVFDHEAHLKAQDGSRCVIRQDVGGEWRVVRGQERPRLQGWHSPAYGQWQPGTTLFFHPPPGVTQVQSRIALQRGDSSR